MIRVEQQNNNQVEEKQTPFLKRIKNLEQTVSTLELKLNIIIKSLKGR